MSISSSTKNTGPNLSVKSVLIGISRLISRKSKMLTITIEFRARDIKLKRSEDDL